MSGNAESSRGAEVQWETSIFNGVIRERKIPADWRKSWLVNFYKGKGDALTGG